MDWMSGAATPSAPDAICGSESQAGGKLAFLGDYDILIT